MASRLPGVTADPSRIPVFEQEITEAVKSMGAQLPPNPENSEVKNIIVYIHRIIFEDFKAGILKLDYHGAGNNRYHRLSKERGDDLKAIDEHVQATVRAIASEIVNNLSLKQNVCTLPPGQDLMADRHKYLTDRMVEKFNNPDGTLKPLLEQDGFREIYKIDHGIGCVIVTEVRSKFSYDAVLAAITEELDREKRIEQERLKKLTVDEKASDADLLNGFVSLLRFSATAGDPPKIQIVSQNGDLQASLHQRIYERLKNQETGMAEAAQHLKIVMSLSPAEPSDSPPKQIDITPFIMQIKNTEPQ